MKKLELLAPARDLDGGRVAVDYGADALYVGGTAFGARAAAGNSVEDIARLVDYARPFGVRVYAALNTLLFDDELDRAERVAREMIAAGVDALIVQDMAFRRMGAREAGVCSTADASRNGMPTEDVFGGSNNAPEVDVFAGVEFHASTQMCNVDPGEVAFLGHAGFSRAILERGLTIDEIRAIRAATDIELECFVHGAICVGFSGRCYLSRSMGTRSGNRGDCMQACRMSYDLIEDGREIMHGKHLLSPLDLDLSARLEELVGAGVTSFKIEGRLKDNAYVKNIVAYYRQRLDALGPKTSSGRVVHDFTPDPRRSFSRGATQWMLGDRRDLANFDTPKAMGAFMGEVEACAGQLFTIDRKPYIGKSGGKRSGAHGSAGQIASTPMEPLSCGCSAERRRGRQSADAPRGELQLRDACFSDHRRQDATYNHLVAGDGICFMAGGELRGTYVNAVDGREVIPDRMDGIAAGTRIFRSYDKAFDDALATSRTRRAIEIEALFEGDTLTLKDADGFSATVRTEAAEPARDVEKAAETLRTQLSKTGDTIFDVTRVEIVGAAPFMPIGAINALRRAATDALLEARRAAPPVRRVVAEEIDYPFAYPVHNVTNRLAERFYRDHGVRDFPRPVELRDDFSGECVLVSSYCLRRETGRCGSKTDLALRRGTHTYRLDFDCEKCRMKMIKI